MMWICNSISWMELYAVSRLGIFSNCWLTVIWIAVLNSNQLGFGSIANERVFFSKNSNRNFFSNLLTTTALSTTPTTPSYSLISSGGSVNSKGVRAFPLSADQLGVPECKSNNDCVVGGICVKDRRSKGRCFCSSSCPLNVPVQCLEDNKVSCVNMGDQYIHKYDMRAPLCFHKRCVCPPTFDPNLLQPPIPGFKATLPMKCDRRDLQAMIVASPSDSVYRGTMTNLFCCINVDPRDFIPENGVYFVQNGTRKREPTSTPYDHFSSDIDTLFTVPTCWSLHINNVQLSDSGSYICFIQPSYAKFRTINVTMEFVVKIGDSSKRMRKELKQLKDSAHGPARTLLPPAPRVIQNVTIVANTTSALLKWDMEEGPSPRIHLELYRRLDRKTKVWHKENVKSPVLIEYLSPATPYTLFITVLDGQADPFKLFEQFQTSDSLPDPPQLEDIRLVNGENGRGQMCEIEWRPPKRTRGHITRYYVQIAGEVRYVSPDSKLLSTLDFPLGVDICSNFDETLDAEKFINPNHFQSFFACKYGPLKPNRNYTATVWAENKAGKSKTVVFDDQCVMDFAQPDFIEPPQTLPRSNTSSFGLRFNAEPDEINGPIACYYLAIIPLPVNVSIENLPAPELIIMDTFDKALQNNLHQSAALNSRFFAYIAESYMQYPKQTVVGDGNTSGGMDPCNVLYLTRYKPLDAALTPSLKYTGFLIARVDRDRSLQSDDQARLMSLSSSGRNAYQPRRGAMVTVGNHRIQRSSMTSQINNTLKSYFFAEPVGLTQKSRRQLSNVDPAYGFSGYFKPVVLQSSEGSASAIEVFLIIVFLCMFVILSATAILYFLYKKGFPPQPIKVEELPGEYIMRHRDSDYQFTQEFEMLPREGKNLDHTISERKENSKKNRYNDIKAADATRIRLRKIPGDNSSDYINANFVKGYKNRKCFIATQGPLECTVGDFWRMVWEQNCKIIIMVTNLRERGREQCSKYWPDEDEPPLLIRNLYSVRSTDSIYYADYTVREFEITSMESSAKLNSGHNSNSVSPVFGVHKANGSNSPTKMYTAGPGLMSSNKNDSTGVTNSSVYSANSRSSIIDRDRTNSITNKVDSDYANVPTNLRPNSNNSNLAETEFSGKDKRRVIQFHYTSWHDYKAPECTIGLLRLLCKLRKLEEYNSLPVIVHCSAGVGRTGTLIAIDHALDQCLEEGKADVFNCVKEMRQQRNLMVQSVEQYVFIYKAIAEYQLFGDTDLTVMEYRSYYVRLRQPLATKERERHVSISSVSARSNSIIASAGNSVLDPTDKVQISNILSQQTQTSNGNNSSNSTANSVLKAKFRQVRNGIANSSTPQNNNTSPTNAIMTLLEAEFNNLSFTLEKPRSVEWSQKEENLKRNRFVNAVPYNSNRVILSPIIGYENTYINASVVKGYFYPYILAQDPLDDETCFDFWRMINDNNSYTVVMLSTEEDFTPQEKYWPQNVHQKLIYGKNDELIVTLLKEDVQATYIQRKLHYRFKSEKGSAGREITQYAYCQWKSDCAVPNSSSSLTIILHCRNGSAENGVFCCISLLLERLKSEHMIDIFRTVKALQLQRPMMFTKLEQYAFTYECLTEYLNSSCG
uniref:protein-tyrosine-phosphatase n=1 Tax=Ditylenchus dipsaci TaxID=166011 RepID=A0A915CNV6_9BILA